MARRTLGLSRFTPLLESRDGLRSRTAPNGRSVYKGVTIIKAGLGNQRDRNYYPAETLERAVTSGRFKGLRAYADHPDSVSEEIQPERTVRDLVGIYLNPRFVREGRQGGRVVADLHLFRSAKWLSETIDDLLDLGQGDKIGLSINGRGKTVEKRLQLEEAADPLDVNWVEDFIVLRSGDVVTEAGAGGGFHQLLESARGTTKRTKERAMQLTAKQKKAIREAVAANDLTKLGALLKECGCTVEQAVALAKETDKPAKGAAKGRKTEEAEDTPAKKRAAAAGAARKKGQAAADDAEADDDLEEAEDEEAADPDAELDETIEDIYREADGAGDPGEDDGEDGADDEMDADDADEDDSVEEVDADGADEDDDDGEDVEEADEDERPARRGDGRHPLGNAADRIRQAAADRGARAREAGFPAARKGAGIVTRGKSARMRTKVKGPGSGKTGVNIIGSRRKQAGQKGRRFGEASNLMDLRTKNERLLAENARLSAQLRVRTTADRARNLLRESAIPEKMRPEILRLMVGKSENEMQRIMRYHERLISTAIEEASYSDVSGGVEGAGARVRESHHGGVRDDDFGALLQEAGIPTREDEE